LPQIGAGPLYKFLTEREAELCQKYWWRNLLFISNWFGTNEMCAFHSQHVSIDFELFLIAPFLVMLLHKRPSTGMKVLAAFVVLSNAIKYDLNQRYDLSEYIYNGMT